MARRPRSNATENRMVRALDTLAQYDEFCDEVMPLLRKAIQEGWTAEELENDARIQALLVARQLSIALSDKDASKALAAIRDARDRSTGKPTEKVEVTRKLEKLPDDQLDARLKSLLATDGEQDDDELH